VIGWSRPRSHRHRRVIGAIAGIIALERQLLRRITEVPDLQNFACCWSWRGVGPTDHRTHAVGVVSWPAPGAGMRGQNLSLRKPRIIEGGGGKGRWGMKRRSTDSPRILPNARG